MESKGENHVRSSEELVSSRVFSKRLEAGPGPSVRSVLLSCLDAAQSLPDGHGLAYGWFCALTAGGENKRRLITITQFNSKKDLWRGRLQSAAQSIILVELLLQAGNVAESLRFAQRVSARNAKVWVVFGSCILNTVTMVKTSAGSRLRFQESLGMDKQKRVLVTGAGGFIGRQRKSSRRDLSQGGPR